MKYWLMKSEPQVFSIDDLMMRPKQTEGWDGVRNYQARNMLRDDMQIGDLAFFYHSSCEVPAIVGIMQIVKAGYFDPTALDPNSPYYDPKSSVDNPRWYKVDVQFVKKFPQAISLKQLKQQTKLNHMRLLQPGNRLSIMPVTKTEWQIICSME